MLSWRGVKAINGFMRPIGLLRSVHNFRRSFELETAVYDALNDIIEPVTKKSLGSLGMVYIPLSFIII